MRSCTLKLDFHFQWPSPIFSKSNHQAQWANKGSSIDRPKSISSESVVLNFRLSKNRHVVISVIFKSKANIWVKFLRVSCSAHLSLEKNQISVRFCSAWLVEKWCQCEIIWFVRTDTIFQTIFFLLNMPHTSLSSFVPVSWSVLFSLSLSLHRKSMYVWSGFFFG